MGATMAELARTSRAEECWEKAEILRLLARKARSPEVRDDLLKLAAGFARLADWIEIRETFTAEAAD
jgi:hypothetical protein